MLIAVYWTPATVYREHMLSPDPAMPAGALDRSAVYGQEPAAAAAALQ